MNQILFLESDVNLAREVQEVLRSRGYQVTLSQTPDHARQLLSSAPPQVALINLNMHASRGVEVLKYIREEELLTTPIAVLDSRKAELVNEAARLGCLAFVDKGHNFLTQLEDLLKQIQHRFARNFRPTGAGATAIFEVLVNLEEKALSASLRSSGSALEFGRTGLRGNTGKRLDYFIRESQRINDAIKRGWRPQDNQEMHRLGSELTEEVLGISRVLYDWWTQVAATHPDLCVVFGSEIELIQLPIELIVGPPVGQSGVGYLALEHALVRRVAGYRCKEAGLSIQSLWGQTPLNVLLIGANTSGVLTLPNQDQVKLDKIPSVDEEVTELDNYFNGLRGHLIGKVRTLAGPDATFGNVKKEFESDTRWDIVHFAGHGINYARAPELSGLVLRSRPGPLSVLYAGDLKECLNGKPPRLVYLNACEALPAPPMSGGYRKSYAILDTLLRAGVPHVLGSRWGLEDDKAPELALAFYRQMLNQRTPVEWALLKARQEMWANYNDRSAIWASPVLVSQVPVEDYYPLPSPSARKRRMPDYPPAG
ncbi:MAG TPA: CHAT domain-containing protein [Blastocatellia bacterium]|nr:CHAT domain-containing protein [Blastocatellia bacterium]